MKTHTLLGFDAITLAERDIRTSVEFLSQASGNRPLCTMSAGTGQVIPTAWPAMPS